MQRDIRCLCPCCRADYERAGYEIIPILPIKRESCDKCERMGVAIELIPAKHPKLVFVCSPFGGLDENIIKALTYCRREVDAGNIPIAPHCYFTRFMNETTERNKGISFGIELLLRCEEMHVYDEPTDGMKREIEASRRHGIKVVYMEDDRA